MPKIEIEHRGLLTKEKYTKLTKFFQKNGQFLEEKKRFSLIYSTSKKSVREVKDSPIDIKLRITNGQPEAALKYGKWSGKDARREFNFALEKDKYWEFAEFLRILGYSQYVMMANTKHDYLYKGIEFSLVEVPEWGHYFEAEILTDDTDIDKSDKLIEKQLKRLDLEVLNEESFFDLLDELNNRDGFRIDLTKTSPGEIENRFKEYFN